MNSSHKTMCHLYSITPDRLEKSYDAVIKSCHNQGIQNLYFLVSVTGKLLAAPEKIKQLKERAERDGLTVYPMIFSIGHPYVYDGNESHRSSSIYQQADQPFYNGPLVFVRQEQDHPMTHAMLPRQWQYAVNEFGRPVFFSACPNAACGDGNIRVIQEMARIFDTIWYDDEFRMDGDQQAGKSTSTANCYCDACLAEVSRRMGKKVTREDVLHNQAIHDEWIKNKVHKLSSLWKSLYEAGRR